MPAASPAPSHRHRHRRHVHRHRRGGRRHRQGRGHQGPEHAGEPRDRARPGRRRASSSETGRSAADLAGLAHGTTVATNALLAGRDRLARPGRHRGLPAPPRDRAPVGARGLRQLVLLGEARAHRAGGARARGRRTARLPRCGARGRSTSGASGSRRASSGERGVRAVGVCLIHSYANDRHERRVRELFREEYPECAVSLSCEVLPEYREYERAMTTLVDAFVKPHMGRYLQRIHEELGPDLRIEAVPGDAVLRRRDLERAGRQQADHHRAVRAGGRRARRGGGREDRGVRGSGDAGRWRHLDRPLPDRGRRCRRSPTAARSDRSRCASR